MYYAALQSGWPFISIIVLLPLLLLSLLLFLAVVFVILGISSHSSVWLQLWPELWLASSDLACAAPVLHALLRLLVFATYRTSLNIWCGPRDPCGLLLLLHVP